MVGLGNKEYCTVQLSLAEHDPCENSRCDKFSQINSSKVKMNFAQILMKGAPCTYGAPRGALPRAAPPCHGGGAFTWLPARPQTGVRAWWAVPSAQLGGGRLESSVSFALSSSVSQR